MVLDIFDAILCPHDISVSDIPSGIPKNNLRKTHTRADIGLEISDENEALTGAKESRIRIRIMWIFGNSVTK